MTTRRLEFFYKKDATENDFDLYEPDFDQQNYNYTDISESGNINFDILTSYLIRNCSMYNGPTWIRLGSEEIDDLIETLKSGFINHTKMGLVVPDYSDDQFGERYYNGLMKLFTTLIEIRVLIDVGGILWIHEFDDSIPQIIQ